MIEVKKINKIENKKIILNEVSLVLEKGKNYIFCGPSGSGKSVFLKTVCGVEKYNDGEVKIEGRDIKNYNKGELAKRVGMIFQEHALFENFTILKNLTYPQVNVLKITEKEAQENANNILKKYNIENVKNKLPNEVSKGLAKKVAILRTLLINPEFMIFDEPTSDLDPEMVHELINIIEDLQKNGTTTLISTNNINFAKKVGKDIVFFNEGKIEQSDTIENFINNPKTERIKDFLNKFIY
jgi:ABC-type polar amino acid transport system ATPase subunit